MKLVLATKNENKVKEVAQFLAPHDIEVVSLNEFPDFPEIEESGETFKDNAIIKASEACMFTGLMALADDSGLEVDYLDGLPGVYSARFAGEDKNDSENNKKLLELLKGVPAEERTARFKCVMAVATTECFVYTTEGVCEGVIAEKPRGEEGFGYDPLFYLPEYGKTFAELGLEIKNKISHRARALTGALDIISDLKIMMADEEEE
ncbi:XTP/dITP diphosphatase [Pelotomaculum propionicicum]|uniref:XTP/dITP diphosphatase n=1 Tax=Pelotomaculum propionicicum TaxID=258475 RepID=UPI003B777237